MKIVIGASRNNLIGSKLLAWWMGVDYSHVYARWYLSAQDREILYQASHGLVHFVSYANFIYSGNIIAREFVIDITDAQFTKFSQKCIDLAGQKYSYIELLQIFLSDASNGRIKSKDQHGYICSELMCELLEDLGITFTKPKHMVKPTDIIEALEAQFPAL